MHIDEVRRKTEITRSKIVDTLVAARERKHNKAVYYLSQAVKLDKNLMKNIEYAEELSMYYAGPWSMLEEARELVARLR